MFVNSEEEYEDLSTHMSKVNTKFLLLTVFASLSDVYRFTDVRFRQAGAERPALFWGVLWR